MQIDRETLEEVEAALADAQSTVSDLCNPDEPTGSAILVMYARCKAADAKARAALARLRKAMEVRTVAGLTESEMREQGKKCGCKGTDEYCPCQNVPFRSTLDARKITGT